MGEGPGLRAPGLPVCLLNEKDRASFPPPGPKARAPNSSPGTTHSPLPSGPRLNNTHLFTPIVLSTSSVPLRCLSTPAHRLMVRGSAETHTQRFPGLWVAKDTKCRPLLSQYPFPLHPWNLGSAPQTPEQPGSQLGHLLRLKSQASHCNDDCSFIFREMTHLLLLL